MTTKRLDSTNAYLPNKATPPQSDTRLGRAVAPVCAQHPGLCGIYSLDDSLDAFAARYRLTELAQCTLDVQYYIWEDDMSGRLLLLALLAAADRGVQVRMLLDDNNTTGMDDILRQLDSHPNIEVRLFNPFSFRTLRALGYLTDFARLNRRMHNKSFTADGMVTLVGGRNIGDAYFGAGEEPLFTDLDVMAIGPVVADVAQDFSRYWNSASVSPLHKVLELPQEEIADSIRLPEAWREDTTAVRYMNKLATTQFATQLESGNLPLIWAKTRLLSDDPRKGQGKARYRSLLSQRLLNVMGKPEKQVDIISSYFVPGRAGVAHLLQLARRGVRVAVLTNSLAANDVTVVHAGYARWRKKLLRHGIELYELKPTSDEAHPLHDRGLTGNSGSSLHAKTFSIDNEKVFIGSFNFDPRSAMLNTEMGFVIDSETLARRIHHRFLRSQRDITWQLRLDHFGRINWVEWQEGKEVVLKKEPQTKFWQRLLVRLVYWLPVEWLL